MLFGRGERAQCLLVLLLREMGIKGGLAERKGVDGFHFVPDLLDP